MKKSSRAWIKNKEQKLRMNENNSLKEIGEQLLDAKRIALFPHIQMDGDAFGAASGLCRALRNSGREAVILLEDKIPDYLQFLDYGYCTMEQEQMEVIVAVEHQVQIIIILVIVVLVVEAAAIMMT